jgi:hypothetical protein
MQLTNPIEYNGQTYTDLALNLAVTLRVTGVGADDVAVALRAVPARIVPAHEDAEGNTIPEAVDLAEDIALTKLIGRRSETDEIGAYAVEQVYGLVQQYLQALGL